MLKFDVHPLLKLKGAKTSAAYLSNLGITKSKSQHLVKKDLKTISISDIEKLCYIFNCTPNDLFTFEESAAKPLPQNSALKKLVRTHPSIPELISGLSVEQASELINKLAEIKNQ
jgi:DNA-binding Xre family transcriptional regulator